MKKQTKNTTTKLLKLRLKPLDNYTYNVIIGLILGDGFLYRESFTSNSYLTITFGQHFSKFANYIFGLLCYYCNPKGFIQYKVKSSSNSNYYNRFIVRTVRLPLLTELHDIFYTYDKLNKKYIKILPLNIIELLTPISLVFFYYG